MSPWLEICAAMLYFNNQITDKFYDEPNRNDVTVKKLDEEYHREHLRDSQYYH